MAMLNVEIDDECFKMYDKMKKRELKIINFKLSPDNKVIHVDHNCTKYSTMKKNIFETWSSDLPDDQCLYSLYDFDILIGMDGMNSSRRNKIGFIFWAPSKSKIKDRMILASAKDNLTRAIEGIQIEWQLNGRDDLDVPDFIEKLGQQPGIRHAGEIIGFEGQSVKVWQNWTSTARDLSQLHGTDRSNIPDYYDKMKARMKESELLEKKRAEERQTRSERLKKTPSLEDRVSSYGRFTYDAAQRNGTAVNQVQKNQVQNLNKYSSGVTSSLSKYGTTTSKPRIGASTGTGISKYGSPGTKVSLPAVSKYGSTAMGTQKSIAVRQQTGIAIPASQLPTSTNVSFRDGVKVVTEEYVVEETTTTKKKKKKKEKEKAEGTELKPTVSSSSSLLARIQSMNLG